MEQTVDRDPGEQALPLCMVQYRHEKCLKINLDQLDPKPQKDNAFAEDSCEEEREVSQRQHFIVTHTFGALRICIRPCTHLTNQPNGRDECI
jgi:hypothetical protein